MNKSDKLLSIRRMFDDSACKTQDRVLAIHFTENSKPVDVSIYEDTISYIHGLVDFKSDDIVLEIGAGSGLLLEKIAKKVKLAYGTDISSEILKLVPEKENLIVQQMDSDKLQFPDASVDKIICKTVVQLFPDKEYAEKCFSEMVRVCRPGGRIYIGDIFNAYLREQYILENTKQMSLVQKLRYYIAKLGGYKCSNYDILFLYPFELREWALAHSCRDFKALLYPGTQLPHLYRKYRFDVLVTK